jgi:nucleoside-diphosphate-sugar epimerase
MDELNGARVVVTGGCGLVGSRIGHQLASVGATAIALDTMTAYPFDYAGIFAARDCYAEVVQGDVADRDVVRRTFARADYVVHAAAYADVAACSVDSGESTRTNVLGTQIVLDEVVRRRPRRFVYVSSASVYGDGPKPGTIQAWREDTPCDPLSVYGNAKLWGERQTRMVLSPAGIDHVALRYFSVYGEPQLPKLGSHSWCVAWFGVQAMFGAPLRLNNGGIQIRDFIHVDDVATATVAALVAPGASNHVLNVGTGVATSVADVAKLVAAETGGPDMVVTARPDGDPLGGKADTTLSDRLLRTHPKIPLAEGIKRYLSWLADSGALRLYPNLMEQAQS